MDSYYLLSVQVPESTERRVPEGLVQEVWDQSLEVLVSRVKVAAEAKGVDHSSFFHVVCDRHYQLDCCA